MSETLEYIDAYFQQALSETEKKLFEDRCLSDKSFAEEVAFYITARQASRDELLRQKQQEWTEDVPVEKELKKSVPVRKLLIKRWMPYAAAACLLVVVATFFVSQQGTPANLADKYMKATYTTFGDQTMSASNDSMQLGISAYNHENYQQALIMFEGIRQRDASNSDAKKYAGLVYYQLNNYDKAIQRFDELAAMKKVYPNMRTNEGDILKAFALLKRDAPGDKEQAKLLLEKVVRENEDGSEKAKEVLDKW